MREILFRGKDYTGIVGGGWLFGALDNTNKEFPKIICLDRFNNQCIITVSPESIGQYTGLTDRNGNKIFEGDIVSFERVNALGYTTERAGEVKYYSKLPIFYILADTGDAWDWCDCKNIKVIGNTHDNPELLN